MSKPPIAEREKLAIGLLGSRYISINPQTPRQKATIAIPVTK